VSAHDRPDPGRRQGDLRPRRCRAARRSPDQRCRRGCQCRRDGADRHTAGRHHRPARHHERRRWQLHRHARDDTGRSAHAATRPARADRRATGPMEDICGPILKRNCDEWHDGGGRTVRLLQAPAISITQIVECFGAGYTRTLTEQNLDAGSFDAYGYTVDLLDGDRHPAQLRRRGRLRRRPPQHSRHLRRRPGEDARPTSSAPPADLSAGCGRPRCKATAPGRQGPEDHDAERLPVPNAVVELCGRERARPGHHLMAQSLSARGVRCTPPAQTLYGTDGSSTVVVVGDPGVYART
jgi:hypothetical protein